MIRKFLLRRICRVTIYEMPREGDKVFVPVRIEIHVLGLVVFELKNEGGSVGGRSNFSMKFSPGILITKLARPEDCKEEENG